MFLIVCVFFTYCIKDCLSDPKADPGICYIPVFASLLGWAGFVWYCIWAFRQSKAVQEGNGPEENGSPPEKPS